MRVLQICNKPPFPAADGGSIAMAAMAKSMVRNGYDVEILSMVSFKHQASDNDVPVEYRDKLSIRYVDVDLRIKVWDAFLNLFTHESYHVQRFVSEAMTQKIVELLTTNKYDVIQFETVFIAPYLEVIRKHCRAKVVLRVHNIEYEVWERTAQKEPNPFKKWYYTVLAKRLRKYELNIINQFDGIITISDDDRQRLSHLGCKVHMANIPFGVELREYKLEGKREITSLPSLFHLGAMDWIPNQLAIDWFLKNVWPRLQAEFPDIKFHIAGRKMPKRFFDRQSNNLIVSGDTHNAKGFMKSKDIMVVPLLSGSGLRIKIIEGMALGKAIVSTSIGAAGIEYQDGENILIANTPDEFFEKIASCIMDGDFLFEVGRNARNLIEKHYSLEIAAKRLENFYRSLA